MNEQTKELIALGASVAAHCQPCLKYHYAKARELGITPEEIQAAMEVGHQVSQGATKAIQDLQNSLLVSAQKADDEPCCGGSEAKTTDEPCCGGGEDSGGKCC